MDKTWRGRVVSLAIIVGLLTAFASEPIVHLIRYSWIWQLVVGATMLYCGVYALVMLPEESNFEQAFFIIYGVVLVVFGLVVFLNFGRYDEIISHTGSWPLLTIGWVLVFAGIMLWMQRVSD